MVVLAERDRALGRLAADQTAAIIDGTDQVLEFLTADMAEGRPSTAPATDLSGREIQAAFHCVGRGRDGRSTTPRPQSSLSHCASRVSRPAASAAADRRPATPRRELWRSA